MGTHQHHLLLLSLYPSGICTAHQLQLLSSSSLPPVKPVKDRDHAHVVLSVPVASRPAFLCLYSSTALRFLAFLFIVRSRRSRRQEHDGTEKKNKRGSAQNLLPTSNSTSSGSSFASGRQVPAMQNVPNYKTASSGAASTPATVTPVTPTMTNWARPEPASNMGAAPTPPKATQAKNGLFFGGLGAGRNARHPTKHKHRLSTTSSTAPILQDGTRLSGDSSRPRYSTDTMASLPSVRAPNMQPNDRFGYAYSGTPEVSSQGRFSSDLPPVAEP